MPPELPPLSDAHNHLQDPWLAPHRDRIFAGLAALPLRRAVVNGTCETDWPAVAALARTHAWILPSYGLHPWQVGNASPTWRDQLLAHLDAPPSAPSPPPALGEIGLDAWILHRARLDDPRLAGLRRAPLDEQLAAFRWQLDLATARNLPATLHCLDAWGPLAAELRLRRPARGFLLHAYNGSLELARELAALGAYFSFNGSFLADRAAKKRAVFAALPADRLLVETDAPAMPLPPPLQTHVLPDTADGQRVNHPANLAAAYAGLAALRDTSLPALAEQIEANFHRFFTSPPPRPKS
ncbi:TatD family hydrolase [Horticoccus luteus]|uniref:TatD family hydrolase n=1 Tax=Horticoccus luteus TaxID=2862869 RepID=A0A8F9TWS4_9BACT|nr:TatD family hydrolase [Horticoccus luteus]QYM79708.1 TatD family hydrolase [Horticoccus luteus]